MPRKTDDRNAFGKLMAELRREKGLTQAELAEKVTVGASAIGLYEAGRAAPSADTADRIISVLTRNPAIKNDLRAALERQASAYYEVRPYRSMAAALEGVLNDYGITRGELGRAIKKGQQIIQFWLNGFRAPAGNTVLDIVRFFESRRVPEDRIKKFRAARIKDMILADSSFTDMSKAERQAVAQSAYEIIVGERDK